MNPGFLYILSNPTMPGLVKVGKTTRDPSDRVKELSAATGVPTPFLLVYYQPVHDCDNAEKWAHAELERRGYRPNSDREFFLAPVHEAVEILNAARSIVGSAEPSSMIVNDDNSSAIKEEGLGEELFQLGMSYLDGTDSLLANPSKALKLFVQASALGHAAAAYRAACVYRFGQDSIPPDLEKSLEFYRKALAGGWWNSLASIAEIFEEAGQAVAAEKHWVRFFDEAAEVYSSSDPDDRVAIVHLIGRCGFRYCRAASKGLIAPAVSPQRLAEFGDAIIQCHNDNIELETDAGFRKLYELSLSFLRSQISSSEGYANGANGGGFRA